MSISRGMRATHSTRPSASPSPLPALTGTGALTALRPSPPPPHAVSGLLPSSAGVPVMPASSSSSSSSGGSSLAVSGQSYGSTRVLDVHDCNADLSILHTKFPARASGQQAYPWMILILSGNLLTRLDGVQRCTRLRKLDLSRNQLHTLPKANVWKHMPHLQILLLHHNKIDSIHALQQLSCLPELEILTVFGNAVEHHPAYRHVLVNVLPRLLLLDFFIVSDMELIEGAQWGAHNKFATYAPTMECDILSIAHAGSGSSSGAAFDASERAHLHLLEAQLEVVRTQHRRFSPVLKLQSLFRGVLVRRTIRVYHEAAVAIQNCWRRYRARCMLDNASAGHYPSHSPTAAAGGMTGSSPHAGAAHPLSSSGAHTLYLVHTSDVSVSLFLQLVRRVEQSEGVPAPELIEAGVVLLSTPDIRDDLPLVRRIYPNRTTGVPTHTGKAVGGTLLPGHNCPPRTRHALSLLRARVSGAMLSEHQRFLLGAQLASVEADAHARRHRLLVFHSPGARFHELLIRAVHGYNIAVGAYDAPDAPQQPLPALHPHTAQLAERERLARSLQLGEQQTGATDAAATDGEDTSPGSASGSDSGGNTARLASSGGSGGNIVSGSVSTSGRAASSRVLIYPGTTVHVLAAAVSIQAAFRSWRARRALRPSLGEQLARARAAQALTRWWRACQWRLRMHALLGLKRYGDSINSRHLFARGDLLSLLRRAPNAFAHTQLFFPEHKAIFGVEPKEDPLLLPHADEDGAAGAPAPGLVPAGTEPVGKLTLVVDQHSPARFYPFPRWLASHWGHAPLPVVHGFTDAGVRVDVSSRLMELIQEGVAISVLPDMSASHSQLDARQRTQAQSAAAAALAAGDGPPHGVGMANLASLSSSEAWTPSNFIKLSFASVEEARNRAVTLALNTWLPQFHLLRPAHLRAAGGSLTGATPAAALAGADMALLMTPQHMTLCLQFQQAGGASGPAGERHVLYTTFWSPRTRTAPPSLYSNQAYLDLQFQLKLVEEAHLAAEQIEQRTLQRVHPDATNAKSKASLDATHADGDDIDSLAVVGDDGISAYNPPLYMLKKESAAADRLASRRMVAQARIHAHTRKIEAGESARAQTVMHRIKMEHLAQREIDARRQRQLDYERLDAAAKAARDRTLARKHAAVHALKHEAAARAQMRILDAEADALDLKRRVAQDKANVGMALAERAEADRSATVGKVAAASVDAARHKRLAEEKESTLAFVGAQNMIARQLGVGMRQRLAQHQAQKLAATVAARREQALLRRQQVHQLLFDNFNRRRASALSQQVELRAHVSLRAVKDESKVALLRARRHHLAAVKALANQAAMTTALSMPEHTYAQAHADDTHTHTHAIHTQQQLHAALLSSADAFVPADARPRTSPGPPVHLLSPSNAAAAYLPTSSLRSALVGGVSLPSVRGAAASPPAPQQQQQQHHPHVPLQPMAGDQLALQMHTLRELAEKVKLQFQTAAGSASEHARRR